MATRPSHIPLALFLVWLHRRRVQGKWWEHEPWDEDWPWGESEDPWSAVGDWIARHTGFPSRSVEEYMSAIVRRPPKEIDQYVSRELFKWWADKNHDKLIRAFWDSYPDVAKSMNLPKPKKLKTGRKRGNQPPRTTLTKQEKKVNDALEAKLRQVDIAKRLRITEGRVSQIVKEIEKKEKANTSRGLSTRGMLPLRDDYSAEASSSKRTSRQRKKRSDQL